MKREFLVFDKTRPMSGISYLTENVKYLISLTCCWEICPITRGCTELAPHWVTVFISLSTLLLKNF